MLLLTIWSSNKEGLELGKINVGHITSFEQNIITYHIYDPMEQLNFIKILIKSYIKFTVEGDRIMINMTQYQRINIRIDAITNN